MVFVRWRGILELISMVVVLRNMPLTVMLVMGIVELTEAGDIVIGDGYCGVDGCYNGENVVNLMAAVMEEQSKE
ncbi:hypothetical protein H5410_050813 [Solanum commersonii]|uniref:Uncharacterized protein n=1 Tax=Solanum commersonii TaxID=4109 RepID=A0A9J5WWM2_SOLCO|nr:hypothetical protein H5410_050813 [Solanum commersonii]